MKKIVVSLVCFIFIFSGAVFAAGHDAARDLSVAVNGVMVASQAPHFISDGKTYVSVEAFAKLFDHIAYDHEKNELNNTLLSNTIVKDGIVFAWVRDLANAVQAISITWDEQNKQVYILALPPGIIPLHEETVPGMGIHYAHPEDLAKGGPVYCVHEGKLYCFEYILPVSMVDAKASALLDAMKGYPSPAVVETSVDYNGNPGLDFDHYTFHMYFYNAENRKHIVGEHH